MIEVLEKEVKVVIGKPKVKRGVLCFIKTEPEWRMHFFSNDRNQDDVPEGYMPLRFPHWTREEAIEKFLCDSTEINNPIYKCQA